MTGGVPRLGRCWLTRTAVTCVAYLYFQLLGQVPGWRISYRIHLHQHLPALWRAQLTTQEYRFIIYRIFDGAPRPWRKIVPRGHKHPCMEYLGVQELRVNFLVGLPKKLALFSEFKDCICKRRRNLIFASAASPFFTTNSS